MRRRVLLASVLVCLLLPPSSFAKDRFLQGRVLLVGEQDDLTPLVGQDVILVESGDTARTKEGGRFRLFLKDIFRPGTRMSLPVEKTGWRIQYPLEGDARVPDDLDKELIEVRLLPIGSKKFWSADRIEKFIRDTAEKAKEQIRPEGKPQDTDFSRYIKDWAVKYGFSAQQAKAEIEKWVAEAEQKNDPYQLGLAAYAKKNFGEAGKLFEESAKGKVRRAQGAFTTARQLTEEAIRDFRLAGDAHSNNYQFDHKSTTIWQKPLLHDTIGRPLLSPTGMCSRSTRTTPRPITRRTSPITINSLPTHQPLISRTIGLSDIHMICLLKSILLSFMWLLGDTRKRNGGFLIWWPSLTSMRIPRVEFLFWAL